MNKSLLFFLFLTMSSQSNASQSYNKLMDIIRQNMSTIQHKPHDLMEYGSTVLVSKDDIYGDQEEILQLSDAVFTLVAALTEQEKAKLPAILVAVPGSFAMKFYCMNGCCSKRFITTELPTVEELDQKSREVKFCN